MKKIGNILLVVDDKYNKDTLIGEIATVSKGSAAQVTLLSVLEIPPAQSLYGHD